MVLFKDVARGLYLGVEGILLEDLVATDGFNLQDSLFCVHLQRQYSASRDLNAFLENYDMDIKSIEDEGAKKYLIALQVCDNVEPVFLGILLANYVYRLCLFVERIGKRKETERQLHAKEARTKGPLRRHNSG